MVEESFHAAAPFIERSIHRARSDDNLSRRHALAIVPCCHQLCQGCATRNATSFVQHRGTMQTRYDGDSGTRRLLQLGYRQTLQRPLMWTSNCAICLGIMSPLTAITGIQACTYKPNFFVSPCVALSSNILCFVGLYSQGLLYGGPVVLIWSWVFTGAVTILVGLAMSELSSAFPVSGGLYFWSFMLAGKYGPGASWCVGWTNLLGQVGLRRLFCCSLLDQRFLRPQTLAGLCADCFCGGQYLHVCRSASCHVVSRNTRPAKWRL